jgi:hypothetical protein
MNIPHDIQHFRQSDLRMLAAAYNSGKVTQLEIDFVASCVKAVQSGADVPQFTRQTCISILQKIRGNEAWPTE